MESLDFVETCRSFLDSPQWCKTQFQHCPFQSREGSNIATGTENAIAFQTSYMKKESNRSFNWEKWEGNPIGIVPYKYFKTYHSVGAK